MAYEKYHKSLVDCIKIKPHTRELVDRCGSFEAAAEYAFVGHMTLRRILSGVHCSVQLGTATKILIALEHRRKEDRSIKRTHERLKKARMAQVQLEEQQLRLLGY
jgi:hypothetical protein